MSRCYNTRRDDVYKDYDWDNDGYPGEFVYGDDVYIDECCMGEVWKPVKGSPEYFVSDKERVYSTKKEKIINGSPVTGKGYIEFTLGRDGDGNRIRKNLHKMIAEAFIPNPHNYPEVRHLNDDSSDNCIENLAWGTQLDNVRDSIRNGTFRYFTDDDRELAMQKRRTPIVAVNFITEEELYFESQQEASRVLSINQSDIGSVVSGKRYGANGYYFSLEKEYNYEDFIYAKQRYSKKRPLIRAINIHTLEECIFKGLTEAAETLGMSVSSVSMALHGKMQNAKGWIFEYVEEGYRNGIY